MTGNILIGLPIYRRAWILPVWMEAIEKQNFPTEKLGFVFELGPNDDETHDLLWSWHERHPEFIVFQADIQMHTAHQEHPEGLRHWNEVRYLTMATLRNNLLEKATVLNNKFDYYFSLDSDIIIEDPETLNKLKAYSEEYSDTVISPLSYMTPDSKTYPSIMSWDGVPGRRAIRKLEQYPIGTPFIADIVMTAVFMPKRVFTKVRYRGHRQGEDLGFAAELHRNKFKSLAATDICCPHIMHRSMLEEYIKKIELVN